LRAHVTGPLSNPDHADIKLYERIAAICESAGLECFAPHRLPAEPEAVFERDRAALLGCGVLVAEVSTPSHGVGMEMAMAAAAGIPVLALCRKDAESTLSAMISGNPAIRKIFYSTDRELEIALESALRSL